MTDPKIMHTWASAMRDEAKLASGLSMGAAGSAAVCYEVSNALYRAAQLCHQLAEAHQEPAAATKRTARFAMDATCEVEEP